MDKSINKIDRFIKSYENFVLSTHESPDADGLGAEIAFKELLESLGKKVIIINSDKTPDIVKFIDLDYEINIWHENFKLPENISEYGLFVLDTNDFDNIGKAYVELKDKISEVFIIDHHEGTEDKMERNYIKVEASSASEIIYELFQFYDKKLSFKSAQAIFTGMVFDTGSFKYPKTSSKTFKAASDCLELGVKPILVHQHLYENNSLNSFSLRGKIIASMEVFYDGRVIGMKLTPEMLEESGASFSEGENSINLPLTVKNVIASVLVKYSGEGKVRVSMRTKGDYDVAEIAMANGGGGHKNAAGFKTEGPVDDTYDYVIKLMEKFFK